MRAAVAICAAVLASTSCGGSVQTSSSLASATFEQWVATSRSVVIGRITDVKQVFPVREIVAHVQPITIEVTEVVRGTLFSAGETIPAIHYPTYHSAARLAPLLERDDVVLAAVGTLRTNRSPAGTASGYGLVAPASFVIIERDGVPWGIRLWSQPPSGGYPPDVETRMQRFARADALHPYDASPLEDLLARARNPDRPVEEHLGYDLLDSQRARRS